MVGGAGSDRRERQYSDGAIPIMAAMEAWFEALLEALALPKFGLSTVFVVALVSATLVPLGSEPAVFGLVKLNPGLFWPAVLVATAGNTIGGAISYWMGYGVERAYEHVRHRKPSEVRALRWLERFGAKACLLDRKSTRLNSSHGYISYAVFC